MGDIRRQPPRLSERVQACWSAEHSHYTGRVAERLQAQNPTKEIVTHSAEETIAFGRTLTNLLAAPKLVLLRGDLGAGKTTLVKGIAAGFEAAAEEDVTSPTFTLIHEYRGKRANLYHVDLYRVDTSRERETLGLADRVGREVPALCSRAGCRDYAGARGRE
jgi:tRNA threonylcarbamoyl adenosine modification protein YjeE